MGLFDFFKKQSAPTPEPVVSKPTAPNYSSRRSFKVVGVTFKNDDGESRQRILKAIYNESVPFNRGKNVVIEEYKYKGEPAFRVNVNGKTIGNISRDDCPYILKNKDRMLNNPDLFVHEEYYASNSDKDIPYTAEVRIYFR